jgi:hypothetical protein
MALRISASRQTALGFLLGALLVGGVVGFTADRLVGDHMCRMGGDPRAMRQRFADDLHLSAAQRPVVDSILAAKHRTIDTLMQTTRPRLDSVDDATATAIKAVLTPDQQPIFDDMYRKLQVAKRERRQAM